MYRFGHHAAGILEAGQTEIQQFDHNGTGQFCAIRTGQENIGRFDIPVRHALGVRVLEATGDLERNAHRITQIQATRVQAFTQGFALVTRHCQKGFVTIMLEREDCANVRMIHPRDGFRFTFKPSNRLFVMRDLLEHKFQGHRATEF
jgi:hypothetical protein